MLKVHLNMCVGVCVPVGGLVGQPASLYRILLEERLVAGERLHHPDEARQGYSLTNTQTIMPGTQNKPALSDHYCQITLMTLYTTIRSSYPLLNYD
jgi:hypothetical protein